MSKSGSTGVVRAMRLAGCDRRERGMSIFLGGWVGRVAVGWGGRLWKGLRIGCARWLAGETCRPVFRLSVGRGVGPVCTIVRRGYRGIVLGICHR